MHGVLEGSSKSTKISLHGGADAGCTDLVTIY